MPLNTWAFSAFYGIIYMGDEKVIVKSENMRNNVQITDIEGLVPKDHLLRKIDKSLNVTRSMSLLKIYTAPITADQSLIPWY